MGKCCHTNCIQRFLDMFMLLQDLPNFFSELCDKCTCYRYSLLFSNPVPWCFIAIRWHIVFNPLLNPYTNLGQPETGCTKQLAVQWTFGMDIFFFFLAAEKDNWKKEFLKGEEDLLVCSWIVIDLHLLMSVELNVLILPESNTAQPFSEICNKALR